MSVLGEHTFKMMKTKIKSNTSGVKIDLLWKYGTPPRILIQRFSEARDRNNGLIFQAGELNHYNTEISY